MSLLALDPRESEAEFVRLGGKPFHARIAREQVFARGVLEYDAMTALPRELRARLARELPITSGVELERRVASDGTQKLLLGFGAAASASMSASTPSTPSALSTRSSPSTSGDDTRGAAANPAQSAARAVAIETVHLPSTTSGKAATLCVSSQAGCPVGCPFCASGLLGLSRNLETHEILEQYVRGRALGPLARSVVMGMGEPLLNYERLARALDVVHDEMGLGARAITVSSVGFPERVRRIAATEPRFQLAISLHTPDQEQRDVLVPAMRGVPIAEVLAAADAWFELTGREVTYEYALLGGANDSTGHATRLARLLARRRATVNLIPWNPVASEHASEWLRPSAAAIERFHAILREHGIVATVRWSKGLDADAACGQLRLRHARSPA